MFTIYSPNIQALRYFQFFNLFSHHNFSKAFFVLFFDSNCKKKFKLKLKKCLKMEAQNVRMNGKFGPC